MSAETPGDRFVLTRDGGFLRVQWDEGVTVSEQDALALVRRMEELAPGLCEPMLAILNSLVSVDAPALAIFATRLNVSALAMVGPSAVDRILVQFFQDVHRPRFPTGYFPEPEAAIEWLLTPGHGTV